MQKILVTGGYGFIGTHLLIKLLEETDYKLYNVDSETYAADKNNIKKYLKNNKQYRRRIKFFKKDISNKKQIQKVFEKVKPELVINVAAESHVDNSITGPAPFINTNIIGTFNLLELSRIHDVQKFVHVSTDEVYGQLLADNDPAFKEDNALYPSSVYSSSKASSDLIALSYYKTFKLNTVVTRCCNNYGPFQHKEKLIPKTILNALGNLPIPVYGDGTNVREWIHASDHALALISVLKQGKPGSIYNIGTGNTKKNIDTVKDILNHTERDESLIEFVEDRKGHDFMYLVNSDKIKAELSWEPKILFEDGIKETVEWYKQQIKS
jgi:dTDP-glucose 4,6-dehydratase